MWYYSLLTPSLGGPLFFERLEQTLADFAAAPLPPPNLTLQLDRSEARLDHPLNLIRPLLVRMNSVIFPVVLAHELGVRVETAPVIFIVSQDFLNICIVLSSTLLVCLHSLIGCALLGKHLLDWSLVDQCEV